MSKQVSASIPLKIINYSKEKGINRITWWENAAVIV